GRRKKEEGRRKKEEGRRKKEEGRRKREEGSSATDSITDLTHMFYHSQLAFYEQAFRPVPHNINFLVEQAEKPVAENGARYQM
ncbi:hypothetical protein QUB08_20960, partial [Microcoleus sp. BR0-C5]|uniref:hypothetical protein n=1 Tax=Microcoleus sp. BR0-C5 TaxID=2818713 RepID=UPI002FD01910